MTRPRRRLLAPLMLLAVLTALPLAGAGAATATYYVDIDSVGGRCSDARTPAQNTLRTPWCTLERAVAAAPAGSTVLVRRGSYPRLEATGPARSSWTTVAAYPGEVPSIDGMVLSKVAYLRFKDIKTTAGVMLTLSHHVEFIGGESALRPAGTRTASAFILSQVSDVVIAERYVHDGFSGVLIPASPVSSPPSSRITIRDNRFVRMGCDGVQMSRGATDVQILRNQFINVKPRSDMSSSAHSDAVQALGPTTRVTVANNLVRGGRGFLFMVAEDERDRVCCGHVDTRIANNVLLGYQFAIRTWSLIRGRIVNNTVWGTSNSTTSGVNIADRYGTANHRTQDLVLANNIIKNLTVTSGVDFLVRDHNLIRTGPLGGPRDVKGSPTFTSSSAGNVALAAGSKGVDAATSTQAPSTDYFGAGRYGAPDVGALERRP